MVCEGADDEGERFADYFTTEAQARKAARVCSAAEPAREFRVIKCRAYATRWLATIVGGVFTEIEAY